ncbi:hypothetical protein E4U46_006185 [Claviceps purpurea]|nr:hypothetical protein E4U46_006185 [Claviceps purpurea]
MSSHTWHPAKFAEYVKNFSDIDLTYVILVLAPISSLTPSRAQILQWRTKLCVRRLPSRLEQVQFYQITHQEACRKFKSQETKEIALHKWIASSVNPSLHSSTLEAIRTETGRRKVTLREIRKKLKASFSPGLMALKAETSTMYKDLLEEARWASTSPDKWIEKWNTTFQKAVRHDTNEIKGANAIHDFIQAVGAKFEPTWAEARRRKVILRETTKKLKASFSPGLMVLKSNTETQVSTRKLPSVPKNDYLSNLRSRALAFE